MRLITESICKNISLGRGGVDNDDDRVSGRVDGDSDDASERSGVAGTWRRGGGGG
jgi:hypothetical protein